MKNKFKWSLLATMPVFSVGVLSGMAIEAGMNQKQAILNNTISNSLIDLTTNKPTSNYFTIPNQASSLHYFTTAVDNQTMVDTFQASTSNEITPAVTSTWNNVLSRDSINTVRSATHYFNFIKNPERNNLIDVIATPVVANYSQIVINQTNFTSVDDSAIFVNNNLVFIGTQNNQKTLVNYKFVTSKKISENGTEQIVTSLDLVDSLDVSTTFGSLDMTNNKFALSPVTKTFSSTDLTSIALWPMGASINDLKDQPGNFIFDLKIDFAGKISLTNYGTDFSATDSQDQIVSITPLQIIGNEGQAVETKFYAMTRPSNFVGNLVDHQLKVYEFGLGSQAKTAINFAFPQTLSSTSRYERVELEKIVPYATVRKNEVNDKDVYSLFWIHQNNVERTTIEAETVPELITRTEVNLASNGSAFEAIVASNVKGVELTGYLGNIFHNEAMPKIHQIHYATDGGLGDSFMAIRVNEIFNINQEISNNYTTAALPIVVQKEGVADQFNSVDINSSFQKLWRSQWDASKNEALNDTDVNMMATIYNGMFTHTEVYPKPNLKSTDLLNQVPLVAQQPIRMDRFVQENGSFINYSTSQINDEIYLPSQPSSDFIGYQTNAGVTSTYNLPVKVAELKFENGTNSKAYQENSALWYARYWLKDIDAGMFVGDTSASLFSFVDQVLFYQDGKLIEAASASNVASYAGADEARFSIFLPVHYSSGITVSDSLLKFNFTLKDNPGLTSSENAIVNLQANNVSGKPSNVANIINAVGETKTIPENQNFVQLNNDENVNNAIFMIQQDYFNNAFVSATASSDDFLGKLEVSFEFMDLNGRIYQQSLTIEGFDSTWIYVPSVVAPLVGLIIIVLIIFIIIRKKTLATAKKTKRHGFLLAKKMQTTKKEWALDEKNKTVKIFEKTSDDSNKNQPKQNSSANQQQPQRRPANPNAHRNMVQQKPNNLGQKPNNNPNKNNVSSKPGQTSNQKPK